MRKLLESSIERAVCDHAKHRGVLTRKLDGMGHRSWPDRMLLCRGRIIFIEFKRKGEAPTPLQAACHKQLTENGFQVYVVDDVRWGKSLVSEFAARPDKAADAKLRSIALH